MDVQSLATKASSLTGAVQDLAAEAKQLEFGIKQLASQNAGAFVDPTVIAILVFMLSCFVGYYVVWHVKSALHSPLMAVTNAVSSVIIVGGIIAATGEGISSYFGLLAIFLASVNIFGGFFVTNRMLKLFRKG